MQVGNKEEACKDFDREMRTLGNRRKAAAEQEHDLDLKIDHFHAERKRLLKKIKHAKDIQHELAFNEEEGEYWVTVGEVKQPPGWKAAVSQLPGARGVPHGPEHPAP